MRRGIYIKLFGLLLMIAVACEKEETILLSGDILGQVMVYDQNQNILNDRSDVKVNLLSDAFQKQVLTSESGEFTFLDIDYGNYFITQEKEAFVGSVSGNPQVHHLGGYSPTILNLKLYEVPTYELELDSVRIRSIYGLVSLWIKLPDWNGNPEAIYYTIRCFFSRSPDVSMDAFDRQEMGHFYGKEVVNDLCEAFIPNAYIDITDSDSIYIVLYPEAWGQGYYEFLPASLGKSSNVLAIKNPLVE